MTKIWNVRRIGQTNYDLAFGYIVRASDEKAAREIASASVSGHDEDDRAVWTDSAQSTCVEVSQDGAPMMIACSFHHG